MYQPPLFREERPGVLRGLIDAFPFATVVVNGTHGPEANHIPLIFHPEEDAHGILRGHVARANPLGDAARDAATALAIFQGPHHYVSPSWYPSKAAHGRVVPTWNYAVVHVRGTLSAVDDPARLLAHLKSLTGRHEGPRTTSWSVDDAPADFIEKQLKGIVGLELRIEAIDGKWKMSQNRDAADRAGVLDGLADEGTDGASAVRGEMEP